MTRRRNHVSRLLAAFAVGVIVAVSGCSSDAGPEGASSSPSSPSSPDTSAAPVVPETAPVSAPDTASPASDSTPTTDTPTSEAPARACVAPDTTTPIDATLVGDDGQDYDITSFDGTVIRAHWFPQPDLGDDEQAPTVLMGPGWGSAGDTNTDTVGVLGALNIKSLWDAGYNVLTWDPRGFGESTGTITVDSPDYEARDVQQLLDWVAAQPQAALDADRDPVTGMVGGSYGGGIQLVTAAIDCRIDAIVPIIAWNSLGTSLFKANTPKTGWAGLLSAASAGRDLDPTIVRANESGPATGTVDPADVQWFIDRGPGDHVADINVPTLIIQGTVDTLFTLDEGVANYELLSGRDDVPVSMLWFCGGHGVCLTDPGDPTRVGVAAVAWLDRYVKGDETVDTGPRFEFVDQDGVTYTAADYPPQDGAFGVDGSGTLQLVADGGAGPATPAPDATGVLDAFVAPITPARATNAVNLAIPAPPDTTVVVGAPELTVTYTGTLTSSEPPSRPTRVFAQLVDDSTGIVLGNQITPIEVILDGASHTVTVPLETIAYTAHPGSSVTLQLVATTVAYAQPQLGGSIDFATISISLPVVTAVSANAG